MKEKTVEILPETNDTTLFIRLRGTVTEEDYMENFDKPVKEIAYGQGMYNLCVIHDESFKGWSEGAAYHSFECISEIGARARRLSYVNAPDSRRLLMKMLSPIVQAERRYFDAEEEEEAIAWMLAYPDEA